MNEQFLQINGANIWTLKEGEGLPVLLINGGPGCCDYLGPISSMLNDFCEVIRFEPRGCGCSNGGEANYDLNTCIKDIERVRNAYKIDRWLVIGHSWGADLALAYALKHPQSMLGMVSISGTGIQNDRDWKEKYVENKKSFGEITPEFLYPHNKFVQRSLITSWRQFIKEPDLLGKISNLSMPAKFVFAEKDIRPSWPIQQLANLISNASYVEIEGAEHYIWLKKHKELMEILKSFIKKNSLKNIRN